MKIRPYGEYVVIKRAKEPEQTKGGIFIPDTARERPLEGEVLAVGHGKPTKSGTLRPLILKPGDRVLFGKYAGKEVTVGGEEHFIIEEGDVLAVFE